MGLLAQLDIKEQVLPPCVGWVFDEFSNEKCYIYSLVQSTQTPALDGWPVG